ncbi:MAG TPA: DUF4062 domain-containing protein [Anaerolineales bacterium]|nr:DUF4062 domain-containing protein [Anaerolineales bacterium]
MAKPRVFISSTFYDLHYIREDLERFVREMGYEPVRHETGSIPYSREAPLEESAYQEVNLSDIIVCIIGGRYGSASSTRDGSITQNELEEALGKQIQVYVFVEQSVYSEYSTYQVNRENTTIKYRFVDNIAIYDFLEKIHSLPQNNPITPFSTAADIINFLKLQWAGLFQRFLQDRRRLVELEVLNEMSAITSTLKELVSFLTEERTDKDQAIKNIISANHPAFRAFASATETRYRVYFTNRDELDTWISAKGYRVDPAANLDDDSVAEWTNKEREDYIKLTKDIFDKDGRLIPINESEWQNNWVQRKVSLSLPSDEDDIPF